MMRETLINFKEHIKNLAIGMFTIVALVAMVLFLCLWYVALTTLIPNGILYFIVFLVISYIVGYIVKNWKHLKGKK